MNENKDSWKENILKFYELVKDDLPKIHLIKTELICWEVKWTETKDLPKGGIPLQVFQPTCRKYCNFKTIFYQVVMRYPL